ncbi:MAG: tetratricopeptide repeat protein [Lachnospiraceae bacterium]|nr:tetratricopeptide repeat protein [Lachnospiraceae bacterium]
MRCIYCNTPLAAIDYCVGCGADVNLLKRIGRISNLLYNRGLEKAQVRDLSGAISCLKQSLKFNKENIDARNLLGLCYYETGEAVSALTEWVISKNLMPEGNLAEQYIARLQNDKNNLDAINQSIRKYNQSIEYCRQGHEDMAVMQLKKVVSRNPHLVKAQQLLAVLYMKSGEYEKARRLLKKALAIDNTNTTTLRYMTHVEETTGRTSPGRSHRRENDEERQSSGTLRYVSGTETIITPTTFRDSSTVATFINIVLGALLGGAIIWFMAVPALQQQMQHAANRQVTDANQQLSSGTAQLQDLQNQISDYENAVENANQERDEALNQVEQTSQLMAIAAQYVNGEQSAAVDALGRLDEGALKDDAKVLYDSLKSNVGAYMFDQYYTNGTTAYVQGDYALAADQLKAAVEADPDGNQANHYNALYYLAFAYFNLGDSTNADERFNQLIEKYPNSAGEVSGYISANRNAGSASGYSTQGEASMDGGQSGGDVTIIDGGQTWSWSDVAWTDPNTGLHYDMYGNLLG